MTSEQTKLVKSDMSLLTRNQRDKNNISVRFAGGRKDGLLIVAGNREGVFTIKC